MILLSFDIEEFEVPLEHKVDFPKGAQFEVSVEGASKILDCLKSNQIKATFFCTANFAINAPEIMQRIKDEGHEIASHGYQHWTFESGDLKKSMDKLKDICGVEIHGYRQARMMTVNNDEIFNAGYKYNSSLNPTFIPGRYMHLFSKRTYFIENRVLQIPSSVTPLLRFPLFWLSYHNLPAALYRKLCSYTLKHDGYLAVYFHPWEFYTLKEHPEWKTPFIIRNNSGDDMVKRLNDFICMFKDKSSFVTFNEFTQKVMNRDN